MGIHAINILDLALENAALSSGSNKDLVMCLSMLRAARGGSNLLGADHALRLVAALDRTKNVIADNGQS